MVVSVMTGERINFLIRACGGMLAGLLWKPKFGRYMGLVAAEIFAVAAVFSMLPATATRYSNELIRGATDLDNSSWLKTVNGGWQLAQDNLVFSIGTGNYRLVAYTGILDGYDNVRPDVHPTTIMSNCCWKLVLLGLSLGCIHLVYRLDLLQGVSYQ